MASLTFSILGRDISVSQKELNNIFSSVQKGFRVMQYAAIGFTVIGVIGLAISNSHSPVRLERHSSLLNYFDRKLREICDVENSQMGQIADGTLRKIRSVHQGFVTTFCNPETRIGQFYLPAFLGGTVMTVLSTVYLHAAPKLHQALSQALKLERN